MTVDLFEFDKSEFIPTVIDYGGAATFLRIRGQDADITLVHLRSRAQSAAPSGREHEPTYPIDHQGRELMKRNNDWRRCASRLLQRAWRPPPAHATDGYFANGYGLKSIGMGARPPPWRRSRSAARLTRARCRFSTTSGSSASRGSARTVRLRGHGSAPPGSTPAPTAAAPTSSSPRSATTGRIRPTWRWASPSLATAG